MSRDFWTLDRVADALGEGPRGSEPLSGVSTDTRAIAPGNLFVALRGDRFDAHEFLPGAVAQGARALVVSRPERAAGLGVPVYAVADTRAALGRLANYRRRALGRPVVGITGTNGKTSTKELTRAALGSVLRVHATTGNLNNLVGVPLTLLAMPDDAEIAVVEMGTNAPGEIAALRAIAEPDIAVVTSVAEGHLEGLGSVEGVLREKSAIFERARVAIAPATQPEIAEAARGKAQRVVTAGLDAGDVRPARWGIGAEGLGWIEIDGVTIQPPLRGAHNLRNAMLALAVARECGISAGDAGRGIEAMPVPKMRLAWEPLGRATLINDAYNANPGSMRAAIELLAGAGDGRQRVAVLGTMRELGAQARALHEAIARQALGSSIEVLAGVGEMGEALAAVGRGDPRVVSAPDVEEVWTLLAPRLARDAVILLKASRGVQLERLVPHLQEWAAGQTPGAR